MAGYKVLNPKGIAYSNDFGRQVIPCGAILDDELIAKRYFRPEGINALIAEGWLEGKAIDVSKVEPEKKLIPNNRKAKIKDKKGGKK